MNPAAAILAAPRTGYRRGLLLCAVIAASALALRPSPVHSHEVAAPILPTPDTVIAASLSPAIALPYLTALPLRSSARGGLQLSARLGEEPETFLVDTGAAMVTISRSVHRRLEREGRAPKVREVAGRLADGRQRLMTVARLDYLELAPGCELRDLEVLVLPGEGTNLLGLNALQRFAPLTLSMEPLSLGLSNCGPAMTAAAEVPAAEP